jgi:hypothetical protein
MGFKNYVFNSMANIVETSKTVRPWALQLFIVTILINGYAAEEFPVLDYSNTVTSLMDRLAEVNEKDN